MANLERLGFSTNAPPIQPQQAVELVTTRCHICDADIMGAVDSSNFQQHLNGKLHKKNAKKLDQATTATDPTSQLQALSKEFSTVNSTEPTTMPPEPPFISLASASSYVNPVNVHRVFSMRLANRDELSSHAHVAGQSRLSAERIAAWTQFLDRMFCSVAREVVIHRPDIFFLQHLDNKHLKEFNRSFGKTFDAKNTFDVIPSPKFPPDGKAPYFHHVLGFSKQKYTFVGQRVLALQDKVFAGARKDPMYAQALRTTHGAADLAVAWICLLESIHCRRKCIVVSVELPQAVDQDLYCACCVLELYRELALIAAEPQMQNPAVIVVGSFSATPSSVCYSYMTTLSAPRRESVRLKVQQNTFAAVPTGETRLNEHGMLMVECDCHLWFDVPVQFPGQLQVVDSVAAQCSPDMNAKWPSDAFDGDIEMELWDGKQMQPLGRLNVFLHAQANSTSSNSVLLPLPFPHTWETDARCGRVRWKQWFADETNTSDNSVGSDIMRKKVCIQDAVVGGGDGIVLFLHGRSFITDAGATRFLSTSKLPPRWDDAIPGLFRSAFSHYRCCVGNDVDKQADDAGCTIAKLTSMYGETLPVAVPLADPGKALRRFVTENIVRSNHSGGVSQVTLGHRAPLLCSGSQPLGEWLHTFYDSPLSRTTQSTEPWFTCLFPRHHVVQSSTPPVLLSGPCTSGASVFDKRRAVGKSAFEFGCVDHMLYLRDRMEIVKLCRLPTLRELDGCLPLVGGVEEGMYPSTHLGLCADFHWPQ